MLDALKRDMRKLADPTKATLLAGFFKTGPGQYGAGDVFLGIMVPAQRIVAKKYRALSLAEIAALLGSKVHEHRFTALVILVAQYKAAAPGGRRAIFDFYLAHTARINNWDLVDLSAPPIVGDYLLSHPELQSTINTLAGSADLWERRIAVLATGAFIRTNQFAETFRVAEMLLADEHDLIHKAVGWMLREVGKRDQAAEEAFLERHAARMPRTMLRYAIERFSGEKRRRYMNL